MRYLTWGLMSLVACSAPHVVAEYIPGPRDCLRSVFKIDAEAIVDMTTGKVVRPSFTGSAVAYKTTRRGDDRYDVFFITARHLGINMTTGPVMVQMMTRVDGTATSKVVHQFAVNIDSVKLHPILDIAIFSAISDIEYPVARLSDTPPATADKVFTIGVPLGMIPEITTGTISGYEDTYHFWTSDSQIIFGNSGGGVFSERTGKLLGISVGLISYDAQIGNMLLKIPVTHLHQFIACSEVIDWIKESL